MELVFNKRRDREWSEQETIELIKYYEKEGISPSIVRAFCGLCYHESDIEKLIGDFAKSQEKTKSFKKIFPVNLFSKKAQA